MKTERTKPSLTSKQPKPPASGQEEKARMLISLLGADFAQNSAHPFFRHLSELALNENANTPAEGQMSVALSELIDALNTPKPTSAEPITQSPKIEPEHETSDEPHDLEALQDQHPAIIAQTLVKLSNREKSALLLSLPGPIARRTALFAQELTKRDDV